ncbi:MAG: nucleoside recognition protein [Deltaproteobacteria bacterium]|nr:nucleoside recognition protein [Deltaproteobacteria bacterium]
MLREYLTALFSFSLKMALILIPLFIILEVLEGKWLRRTSWARPFKALGLSAEACIPLLSGLTFGLLYGAGLIIDSLKNSRLSTRETLAILLFLSIFHSVFEDTLLFLAVGADFFIITIPRVIMALLSLLILKYIRIGE